MDTCLSLVILHNVKTAVLLRFRPNPELSIDIVLFFLPLIESVPEMDWSALVCPTLWYSGEDTSALERHRERERTHANREGHRERNTRVRALGNTPIDLSREPEKEKVKEKVKCDNQTGDWNRTRGRKRTRTAESDGCLRTACQQWKSSLKGTGSASEVWVWHENPGFIRNMSLFWSCATVMFYGAVWISRHVQEIWVVGVLFLSSQTSCDHLKCSWSVDILSLDSLKVFTHFRSRRRLFPFQREVILVFTALFCTILIGHKSLL